MYQVVDATPYRGKRLAYRASVRADLTGSVARLLVRIHREDGSTSFRDDMGNYPITLGTWTVYEIDAPIIADARDIEFGMQLIGEGSASIENISLTFEDPRKEAVRALIQKFADSRNAHDGSALAALYSEDGEWIGPNGEGPVRGRQALAEMWGGVPGKVERTIQSIGFPGDDVAVVLVTITMQPAESVRRHETFVVVNGSGGWHIRVHQQTVD